MVDATDAGIVNRRKLVWAVGSFEQYKSSGPGGMFLTMLQKAVHLIIPWLKKIFKECLRLNYVPKAWQNARVVFIAKAGNPKDYKHISLTSFLLKRMEKLLEMHIREIIGPNFCSNSQHAYLKGRPTESALHSLVAVVEKF